MKINYKKIISSLALFSLSVAAFAVPEKEGQAKVYANHAKDVSWVAADSDIQKDFDFSGVPGTPIAHSPAASGIYLGSPHLAILPDGAYIAAHDLFGKNWNYAGGSVTIIYRSDDKGETWKQISRVDNQGWSSLFVHGGNLYIIGNTTPVYNIAIRKSTDGGRTWTEPKDSKSGIIFTEGGCMSTPTPVLEAKGRIFYHTEGGPRPFKKAKGWAHQSSSVISAPADADLLDAANWTRSNYVSIPEEAAILAHVGWLEGNMVYRKSDDKIFNMLRVHGVSDELAAVYEVSADGKTADFNVYKGFVRFPGACKKFYIQYDEKSEMYYALTNWVPPSDVGKVKNCPHPIKAERTRNTLALARSKNLEDWEVYSVILHDNDIEHSGFQYPSFVIDGDDIVLLSRTAFPDGEAKADNQHNSNFITFHRIEDFRDRTMRSKPLFGKFKW